MPGKVLTDPPDSRPVVGFFGKLPGLGDFVERGLAPEFRRNWDRWLSHHILPRLRAGAFWSEGGLRFRLVSGGHSAAGVIVPSQDAVGRLFPFSLLMVAPGALSQPAVEAWCDAALPPAQAALAGQSADPDALWQALAALPAPDLSGPATGSMLIWTAGSGPAAETDQEAIPALLDRLLPIPIPILQRVSSD